MTPISAPVAIATLPFSNLEIPPQPPQIQRSLEQGNVLYLPQLAFSLTAAEQGLLTPELVAPRRKNISYQPDSRTLKGVADQQKTAAVARPLARYHQMTLQLIDALLPGYGEALHHPQTSLRLHPITAWREKTSWRKDDSRLHVDAFPSRPVNGERILRVFCNIHPRGEPRTWRTGEHFDTLAARFLPQLKPWSPFGAWLQSALGITKTRRSHYDHLMLALHDAMKSAPEYQRQGAQQEIDFAAGSTWICFSDQTPHAAMRGQYLLEQTFLLPVSAMTNPQLSPLRVLETLLQKPLVARTR
ncbi:Kdo hydroxylase family protein [Klebsiella quasivariicola]|uniref:Kdo hydroxylase family protein n=1 Tax=Klebsiella quasivariicola TaxID=2026240 RepID=UPI001252E9C4|nr:Kdo hydroxylase family protein [Klebsiella quasivariicola]VAN45709.1 Protein of uncharacterised function (DUF2843) [Klebsiella quasivariicola]